MFGKVLAISSLIAHSNWGVRQRFNRGFASSILFLRDLTKKPHVPLLKKDKEYRMHVLK